MRLLLDTHIAIWLTANDPHLPAKARELILHSATSVHVSIVSIWEVAIKRSLSGKREGEFNISAAEFADDLNISNIEMLAIERAHVIAVEALPLHHGDPFDRLLVAQALHEPMRLVTSDETLSKYSDSIVLV